jgi:4-hydroxybenzoate polyprenyltransferase
MPQTPVGRRQQLAGLVTAAHPGPATVVTLVSAVLAVTGGLSPVSAVTVVGAVLAGQLTVGWGNDLLDVHRDRAVDRADKPLATGQSTIGQVGAALAVAGGACVVLSFAAGWRSALVHLLLCLVPAHAYNLGVKATSLSWVPYAVAFGSLPAVVALAAETPAWPPWWTTLAGACLGVGAHLLNALPDLADDRRTGVHGLPHRLGERTSRTSAVGLLVAASLLAGLGGGRPSAWTWAALLLVAGLAALVPTGRGRLPFRAALGIAVLDVVLLVA